MECGVLACKTDKPAEWRGYNVLTAAKFVCCDDCKPKFDHCGLDWERTNEQQTT